MEFLLLRWDEMLLKNLEKMRKLQRNLFFGRIVQEEQRYSDFSAVEAVPIQNEKERGKPQCEGSKIT